MDFSSSVRRPDGHLRVAEHYMDLSNEASAPGSAFQGRKHTVLCILQQGFSSRWLAVMGGPWEASITRPFSNVRGELARRQPGLSIFHTTGATSNEHSLSHYTIQVSITGQGLKRTDTQDFHTPASQPCFLRDNSLSLRSVASQMPFTPSF